MGFFFFSFFFLLTLRCFTAWMPISFSITAVCWQSTSTMRTCSLAWKYPMKTPSRSTLSSRPILAPPGRTPGCCCSSLVPLAAAAGVAVVGCCCCCLSARRSSAPYAGTSSCTDSSSGVRLGRKASVGKMASSNTLARPVSCRVRPGNLARKSVRMSKPRRRTAVLGSSARVSRTGMKSGQCFAMSWSWSMRLCLLRPPVSIVAVMSRGSC